MQTHEAEKTDISSMDVSGHVFFVCLFVYFLAERKSCSICVSLSPSSEFFFLWTRSNVRSSLRLPEHQIGRAVLLPSPHQQKCFFTA
ncbi:hypothetical protein EXN66_Car019159 [Channa argus]|uniref:Uncharacterized protein n=1 Tax=Channa argus TaxID=215402 RepID=A0A6G1QLC9_CHAAH|nr:hypothetical protein EXN66_Car019159 [Channa argus]